MCRKHIRTRTFVKVGDETNRYRDNANLLAHMELPSTNPSQTILEETQSAVESNMSTYGEKDADVQANDADIVVEMPEVRYNSQGRRNVDINGSKSNNGLKRDNSSKAWEHIDLD